MLLGDLLLARGLVTNADVEAALARQEKFGGRIGENLIALGVLTRKTLDGALREQYELARAILAGEDSLAKSKRINGTSHPKTNRQRCRLVGALIAAGHPVEALSLAQTALAGHQEALGGDHPWTKDSAQAVADAAAAIERAASSGGPDVASSGEAGEQHDAITANDRDVARIVDIAERGDRAALVGHVTARFVGKSALDRQQAGHVRRIIGVLARRR
jgi:hypothetical protein